VRQEGQGARERVEQRSEERKQQITDVRDGQRTTANSRQ
jgi:hypothetical protein